MRRWFMSAAVLTGLAVTAAHAEYVVIRVYVGGGAGGNSSRGPGDGNPMGPGGGIGPGDAGEGGFGPGRPGGAGAGAGFGGPGRPGGAGGFGPMGPGPMGPGGPMGGGFGPMGPGGAGGGFGPPPPGGPMGGGFGPMGPGGGLGPMGPGGGMGLGGGMGAGGGLATGVSFDTYESYVMVAVEVDRAPMMNDILRLSQYRHPWGKAAFFNDNSNILTNYVPDKSPLTQYKEKKARLVNSEKRDGNEFLNLAEFALMHGLVNECAHALDDLAKQPPAGANERVKSVLTAYKQVKDDLAKSILPGAVVDHWKQKLSGYTPYQSSHYVVFYSEQTKDTPPEVTRRLNLLEQNMRAFYLWFALRGKTLPVPEEKLVAVLVPDAAAFKAQRAALNSPHSVSDGVFAARDNIALFTNQRMDEAYQIFAKMMQSRVWQQGLTRQDLLAGKDVPKGWKKGNNWRDEYRICQTLALVDKALEHEAEFAAVSHEGTKQLTIAVSLYPRSVAAPEWIQFGFASLFDTPKGPYPGPTGTGKVAFWPTYAIGNGGANWAYLRPFRIWAASKDTFAKLDEPAVALKRTVTDYYFQNARKEVKDEIDPSLTDSERKKKEKEIARAKEERLRAHTQAWALTYYLARHKMDGLMTYFQELANMPRDLELDEQTMLLTFAKAFKLMNAEGTGVDEAKVSAMAADWFARMNEVVLHPDYALNKRQDDSTRGSEGGMGPGGGPAGGPGGPAGPGGFGPGGPGGKGGPGGRGPGG